VPSDSPLSAMSRSPVCEMQVDDAHSMTASRQVEASTMDDVVFGSLALTCLVLSLSTVCLVLSCLVSSLEVRVL